MNEEHDETVESRRKRIDFRHKPTTPRAKWAMQQLEEHIDQAAMLWIRYINGATRDGSAEFGDVAEERWELIFDIAEAVEGPA